MIRPMKKTDWPRVSAIYTQGIEEGKATFRTECPSEEQFDVGHCPDCRFVYETDGCVVGWIAIMPMSAIEAYHGSVELSVYVDRDYRGQGIGRELLLHLIAESEKAGYWSLCSRIFAENERSIALHRACGFRLIGRRERIAKDRFGRWLDTVLMEYRNNIE